MISDFYDLDVWKQGHKLVLMVYKILKTFPKEEKFGVCDQLRRASSSITANIAEGYGRYHFTDKIRFFIQARGSVKEVQNFILLSKDLQYITDSVAKDIWGQTKSVEKLINGLIKSTENHKY